MRDTRLNMNLPSCMLAKITCAVLIYELGNTEKQFW